MSTSSMNTTIRARVWTGPCGVDHAAQALRKVGCTDIIHGTEHVIFSCLGPADPQTWAFWDLLGALDAQATGAHGVGPWSWLAHNAKVIRRGNS